DGARLLVDPLNLAFIGDEPPGPLAFNDDDTAIFIDFAIACRVDLQKLAYVACGDLHDLVLIIDIAELVVELEEELLTALGLVHLLSDLLSFVDVLQHTDEVYRPAALVDDAATHVN